MQQQHQQHATPWRSGNVRSAATSDSEFVARELLCVCVGSLLLLLVHVLLEWGANNWWPLAHLVASALLWAGSLLHPLLILRDNTERQRTFLQQNREQMQTKQQQLTPQQSKQQQSQGNSPHVASFLPSTGVTLSPQLQQPQRLLRSAHPQALFDFESVLCSRRSFPCSTSSC